MDGAGLALLFILTIAFVAHLYFLSSFSKHGSLSSQSTQDLQIRQLEAAISKLELQNVPADQSTAKGSSADLYQQGLRQHEALLQEVRTELNLAHDQLRESNEAVKTAREATQRMQDGEAAFLAIFGIIGAFIAGQGYLQIRGWNERAQEALDAVSERSQTGLSELEGVKPDLEEVRDARENLKTELPTFLDAARGILNVEDATGPIQQADITLMDQIDHFTFLNAPMRFRRIRSNEEAEKYIEGLRVAARGHLARGATWEAMDRLDEYFVLAGKFPGAVTHKNRALAYSYRAVGAHQQLSILAGKESWILHSKAAEVVQIRDRAFADIKRARECYAHQDYGDFAEALLYSLKLAPDAIGTKVPADEVILQGQQKAADLYRKLNLTSTGRKRRASLQNLACCLKRIAAMTGDPADYLSFEAELESYPTDKQLCEQTDSEGVGRIDLIFLWQGIIVDEELFASIGKLDLKKYRAFWRSLLGKKVLLRSWSDDLAELRVRNPKMTGWAVIL
jgi:hypothetical protein